MVNRSQVQQHQYLKELQRLAQDALDKAREAKRNNDAGLYEQHMKVRKELMNQMAKARKEIPVDSN